MNGSRALEYARSRMSTTDFDRAKRQQQILLAIRDKAMSLNLLPKLPALAKTMAANVETDMSMEQMVELARSPPDRRRPHQEVVIRETDGLRLQA
jgi:polyisoprenyl-teichoic acid--peptidoglycan teichoic acid transferase